MFTANTMSSALEVLGMSLPYSSSIPAEYPEKAKECYNAAKYLKKLLELDLKPRYAEFLPVVFLKSDIRKATLSLDSLS